MAATVDTIDPARAWQPWHPTAEDPWGPKWAAHLYRRAGFGASREEILERLARREISAEDAAEAIRALGRNR